MDMIASGMAEALLDGEEYEDTAPVLVPLPDGRLLALPQDRIRPILAPLLALFSRSEDGRLGVSRFDAAALSELEEAGANAGLVWTGGDAVRDLGRRLRDAGGIPHIKVPASFRAELRPYQAQGVDWMGFLGGAGLGGVLADDMGLGKTVQTLAHLVAEQADRPAGPPGAGAVPDQPGAELAGGGCALRPGRCACWCCTARIAPAASTLSPRMTWSSPPIRLLSRDGETLGRAGVACRRAR